jgi:hypothetical protein
MAEKKKLTTLQRVQAKAIYNFHARKRAQEEEARLQEQLDNGTFFEDQLGAQEGGETYEPSNKKGKK